MITIPDAVLPLAEGRFEELQTERKRPKDESTSNSLTYSSINNKQKNEDTSSVERKDKKLDFSELASKLGKLLDNDNLGIEFSLDQESKRMILKVIDNSTKEVVRQFPPEITLKIARIVANSLEGGQVTNAKV